MRWRCAWYLSQSDCRRSAHRCANMILLFRSFSVVTICRGHLAFDLVLVFVVLCACMEVGGDRRKEREIVSRRCCKVVLWLSECLSAHAVQEGGCVLSLCVGYRKPWSTSLPFFEDTHLCRRLWVLQSSSLHVPSQSRTRCYVLHVLNDSWAVVPGSILELYTFELHRCCPRNPLTQVPRCFFLATLTFFPFLRGFGDALQLIPRRAHPFLKLAFSNRTLDCRPHRYQTLP